MTQQPKEGTRFVCPACGRYLGTVDGRYFEAVPCVCGWAITAVNKRLERERLNT